MRGFARRTVPAELRARLAAARTGTGGRDVASVLDTAFYLQKHEDVADANLSPGVHFRAYGMREGRQPSAIFSQDYVYSHLSSQALVGTAPTAAYVNSGLAQKPRIVFVSHDASRTGAPAIILRLLEIFSKSRQFECFTLLDEGGERFREFAALSHTYQMKNSRRKHHSDQAAFDELATLFGPTGVFQNNQPICALVNSAETTRIGHILNKLNIPVVSLVHEIAAYYQPHVFEDIAHQSEKVIFPSQFVSQAAEAYCDLDMSKTLVRGQGLLEDGFGEMDQQACRRVLRERLEVEEDAFIVLNVGTADIRKGPDFFVDIANLALQRAPDDRPVYFIWHGNWDPELTYPKNFLKRHNLEDRVRFLPSTPDIEQVFLGGDLFLLTARADPFPCVIHEAMICGLPVIAFRNGGGAPELVGDACGTIVEMGDLSSAANAIVSYMNDPEKCAHQGAAAREKIAGNWQYHGYFEDVYDIVKSATKATPAGGWPLVSPAKKIKHLIVMRGCIEDLATLEKLDPDTLGKDTLVTLLDGRFGAQAEEVVQRLKARGLTHHISQPAQDTDEDRAIRLLQLLKNPKPERLTVINTLQHLPETFLRQVAFPVEAVVSSSDITAVDLYRYMRNLSRIVITNPMLADELCHLNPKATEIVVTLDLTDEAV